MLNAYELQEVCVLEFFWEHIHQTICLSEVLVEVVEQTDKLKYSKLPEADLYLPRTYKSSAQGWNLSTSN